MNRIYIILLSVLVLSVSKSLANDTTNIFDSYKAISGWEDVKFDDSGVWDTVDVTTQGIEPNKDTNWGPAIQTMIMGGSGKTIYKFPAGVYKINTSIQIGKSDFQILGEGKETKFLLPGGTQKPRINIAGKKISNLTLQSPIERGDEKITLKSVSGVSVGDYLFIAQANGERAWDLDDQMVKVLAIDGNTLAIDMKMGLPFKVDARVEKCLMYKNIKLSNFYIERTTAPSDKCGRLTLAYIFNAEISNIESKNTLISHFTINNSRNVLFFNNDVYGNYGKDHTGGYQYGVTINRSTRVNIIYNRFSNLRHHVALQFGTDHSVIAYNRTTKYNHYADYGQHNSKGCHNNLFEGNFGEQLYDDLNQKAWGTPYVVWFRNHAIEKIGSEYPGQNHMTIIGNELRADASGLKKGEPNLYNFSGANIVSINKENGKGVMIWGDLDDSTTIPNSLFLTEKPDYLPRWPLYGPGVAEFDTAIVIEPDTTPVVAGDYTLISVDAQQDPNVAANMFDGNTTDDSRWSAEEFPKSVVIDLGEEKELVGTKVWTYQSRAYQYMIELSNSATEGFTKVVDRLSNTSTSQPIANDFSMKSGRYVRFTVEGCDNYSSKWVSITELAFVFNETSGTGSIEEERIGFDIFPNPNKGHFTITTNNTLPSNYSIYSMNGKEVDSGIVTDSRQIHLPGLPSGIYLYKGEIEGLLCIQKIIIQ